MAKFRETPPPPQPELFLLYEEEPSGWPQVQRHTVEQLADFAPMVQIIDVPGPQVVDQLVYVPTLFGIPVPGRVIEVPMVLCPSRPLRAALAAALMTEQLVEVPTDVVLVVPRQPVEQIVDIPVPGARGSCGNGQSFLSEHSFPHSSVEQIVDIPVPGGGLQDFLPDHGSADSSAVLPDEPFEGFFRTFPRTQKSAKVTGKSIPVCTRVLAVLWHRRKQIPWGTTWGATVNLLLLRVKGGSDECGLLSGPPS